MHDDRTRRLTVGAADWDAYIASAPSFSVAQTRMQEAVMVGVDFAALLELQAQR